MLNLRIGSRLALGFGLVVGLMLLIAVLSLLRLSQTTEAISSATTIRQYELRPLFDIREHLAQTGISARNALIMTDDQAAAAELQRLDQHRQLYMDTMKDLDSRLAGRADFTKARKGLGEMSIALDRVRSLREAHKLDELATFIVTECNPLRRRIVGDLNNTIASIEKELDLASKEVNAVAEASTWTVLSISLLAIFVSIVFARKVAQSILHPVESARTFAAAIERGDLSSDLHVVTKDELGALTATLRQMRHGLHQIVVEVRAGATAILGVTKELSAGNLDLSHRSEAQASSLEQTAASIETLANSIGETVKAAQAARLTASAANDTAMNGNQVMDAMAEKMDAIDAASQRIVDIVDVIDSLSFQTNILALNAAVEAARAGPEGRGFAVVASEVGTLAHRSATAAREM